MEWAKIITNKNNYNSKEKKIIFEILYILKNKEFLCKNV